MSRLAMRPSIALELKIATSLEVLSSLYQAKANRASADIRLTNAISNKCCQSIELMNDARPTRKGKRPEPAAVLPSRFTIIRLLGLLKTDADAIQVADELRQDPILCYRLLSLVNSAAGGFHQEIKSYQQAITILGYQQLHRWMAVLLVTAQGQQPDPEIIKSSLVRGRFLELFGKAHFSRLQADDMFIVGVFSRLNEILGLPLDDAIDGLSLSEPIRAAVLSRDGFYGKMLQLAEAIEVADEQLMDRRISEAAVEFELIYETYNAAVDWVDQLPV